MNKYLLTIILSAVLIFQLAYFDIPTAEAETANTPAVTADNGRMSGVWVSTTLNLDYPSKRTTDSAFLKSEADKIIDNCADMGITDIFFQVRPACDAFYKSDIYCWSHWLTGSQGTAPSDDFDPLAYWISRAHSKGMRLHAWVNPYRVTNETTLTLDSLAYSNPARKHPEWVVPFEGKLYFDPAIPEVQELVIKGVEEIVNNYDIDGIHLDDYFYPGQGFDDSKSYALYANGTAKDEWRRNNVNTLVKTLHDRIKALDPSVEFGISPVGVWANKKNNPLGSNTYGSESYYKNYADSRKWALEGWIDYIAPQIYWQIGNETIDYKEAVNWWVQTLNNCNTKLYIGLADYKCDGVSASSPWYAGKAIKQQLDYDKSFDKISGEIHFRYKFVNDLSYIKNILKTENGVLTVPAAEIHTEATTSAPVTQAPVASAPATTAPVTQAPATTAPVKSPAKLVNNTDDIQVYVDGNIVNFDTKPVIQNSRTLVPFRAVFEALGAEVSWNNDTQQVRAKKDNTEISFVIGEKVLLINQKNTIIMEVRPQIMSGRSMVPLRAVSEALNAEVNWDNDERIITINTK